MRIAIAVLVLLLHIVALRLSLVAGISVPAFESQRKSLVVINLPSVVSAPNPVRINAPINLHAVAIELSLPIVDYPEDAPLVESAVGTVRRRQVLIPFRAPRPDPSMPIDLATFAARTGLPKGQSAAVILAVDVLADGATGDVTIETSSGNVAIDQLAIDYARALRWLAGIIEDQNRTVRVRLPVRFEVKG
ncbi:MAG: energy transducer TonB [Proteobacteria bacterium]|nr:energy transducer TonB [Pseudomonadota bacterium]